MEKSPNAEQVEDQTVPHQSNEDMAKNPQNLEQVEGQKVPLQSSDETVEGQEPHQAKEKQKDPAKQKKKQEMKEKEDLAKQDLVRMEDDLFHDDTQLSREEQLRLRDGMKNAEPKDEEESAWKDGAKEEPAKRKPGRPIGKAKAKGKAKPGPKPKDKAKAKAKASAKGKAKPKDPAKDTAEAGEALEPEAGEKDIDADEHASEEGLPATSSRAKRASSASQSEEKHVPEKKRKIESGTEKAPAKTIKEKATFARRYKPQKDMVAARRWTAMKDIYELKIGPRLKRPLALEDIYRS